VVARVAKFLGLGILLCGSSVFASTMSFTGVFSADDNVVLFQYSVPTTDIVTIATTSYATGGFSPILSLFDNTGTLVFTNDGYSNNSDALITWNSIAGETYTVALTEYDNFPFGPTLADGFQEQGNGNFTAQPPFNPPLSGGFYLPGPVQLTGDWAVSFSSAAVLSAAVAVPEPGCGLLMLAGLMVLPRLKRLSRF
jgi:hypothetical protein